MRLAAIQLVIMSHSADEPGAGAFDAAFCSGQAAEYVGSMMGATLLGNMTPPDPDKLWPALCDTLCAPDWDPQKIAPKVHRRTVMTYSCLLKPLLGSTTFSKTLQGPLLGAEIRESEFHTRLLTDFEFSKMGMTADGVYKRSLMNLDKATPRKLSCGNILPITCRAQEALGRTETCPSTSINYGSQTQHLRFSVSHSWTAATPCACWSQGKLCSCLLWDAN